MKLGVGQHGWDSMRVCTWGASNFQVSDHSYLTWSSDPNLTLTLAKILNMIIILNLTYKPIKLTPTLTLILTLNLSTCVQFQLSSQTAQLVEYTVTLHGNPGH